MLIRTKNNNDEVYYIGINANNAICNSNFFAGSITMYPTNEKGNIYYSNKKIDNIESNISEYTKFIYENIKKIQSENSNARFIVFNEKIEKICSKMKGIEIITGNDANLIKFINNKIKIRKYLKDIVPILDYKQLDNNRCNYEEVKKMIKSNKFVIQAETGVGGNSTFLISNANDINKIKINNNNFCISKYVNNLPLNITLIIGNDKIIIFPVSVQLILICENKFRYVGGDFIAAQKISKKIITKINNYSILIAKKLRKLGYKGIVGIDYILCDNNEIKFMEINPRFQSSSFLISIELEKQFHTNIAELHYKALTGKKLENIELKKINKSFINCNKNENYEKLLDYEIIKNGYFNNNKSSIFRKVFRISIIDSLNFQKIIINKKD